MILALALNDYGLLRKVYEQVPPASVPAVVASVGAPLLPALLWFLSLELRPSTGTPHFQFRVLWVNAVVDLHFVTLLDMSTGKATARTGSSLEQAATARPDVAALALQLLVELSQRHAVMAKTFDNNTYLLRYLGAAPQDADSRAETVTETHKTTTFAPAAGSIAKMDRGVDFFSGFGGANNANVQSVLEAVAREEGQAKENQDPSEEEGEVETAPAEKSASRKKRKIKAGASKLHKKAKQ